MISREIILWVVLGVLFFGLVGVVYQQYMMQTQQTLSDDEMKTKLLPEIRKKLASIEETNTKDINSMMKTIKEINDLDLTQQNDINTLKNEKIPELSKSVNSIQTSHTEEISKLNEKINDINKLNLLTTNDLQTLKDKLIPELRKNVEDLDTARKEEVEELKRMLTTINESDKIQNNDISKLKTLIVSINNLITENKINFGNWSIEKDANDLCVKNSSSNKSLCIDSSYNVKLK